MTVGVFLDDWRWPKDVKWVKYPPDIKWRRVTGFLDFEHIISEFLDEHPTHISLDYDLNSEKTGLDCLKWLVEYCAEEQLPLPEIYFHTQHDKGKHEMTMFYKLVTLRMGDSKIPVLSKKA